MATGPKSTGPKRRGAPIVVAGGANLDIKSRIARRTVAATSNPGLTSTSGGGVARNIAENLAHLRMPVQLLSVVGEDAAGDRLLVEAREAGIDTRLVMRRAGATGSYAATMNSRGELLIAVSDMRLIDNLKPRDITRHATALRGARLLVADCNLPPACLAALARLAVRAKVPLLIDPVSVPKARRLAALLRSGLAVTAVTPNRDELAALAGFRIVDETSLDRATRLLHRRGVTHVLVGLGAEGCCLSSAGPGFRWLARLPAAVPPRQVADVTGGGDALVAGFAYGLATGLTALQACTLGQALAARAVRSSRSVATPRAPRTTRLRERARP
ncbi:MAG: carbohydrate kinase family protein [Rhodospirillaceae bacterium]|nr:carbohydrate kinase family protein [Rhodospirillaceae bacterium]